MKKKLLLLPLILGIVYVLISSYSGGPIATSGIDGTGSSNANGCSSGGGCHGASSSSTTVTLTLDSIGAGGVLIPVPHYIAGDTYKVVLTGTNTSSVSLPKYGYQIALVKRTGAGTTAATEAGSLSLWGGYPAGSSIVTLGSRHLFEHSTAMFRTTGSGTAGTQYIDTITWIAPTTSGTGTIIAYGVLNAVNANGASSGDKWYNASDTLTELIPGAVAPITGTATVCVGLTSTLACATTGGTWSSSNATIAAVSSSGVVTGITVGTCNISYATGSGFAFVPFTVTASASAGTISGASSVCQGLTTPLTSTVGGGTWSSSATSIATVGSSSGIVTGVTPGTLTITYTATTSCGTAFTTKTITVNPNVSAGSLSGTTIVCVGTTVAWSSTVSGGTWTSSNPSIATISSSGVIAGASVGGATITYSVTGACGTATQLRSITVNPAPSAGVISGSNFICLGSAITLSESMTGGTWSSSNTSVATITTGGVVTSASIGNTTISYAVTGICGTTYATQNIHVDTIAYAGYIAGPPSICIGIPVMIWDSLGAGGTWSSSNPSVATIDGGGFVTGLTTGTTTISYLIPPSGSCGTDTATRAITIFVGVPAIGGTTTTCVNRADTLTNAVPSGLWTSSNSSVLTAAAGFGIITGITAGTAIVTYTSPAGCRVTTGITVNRIPGPITGVLSVCPGQTTALTDTSIGGVWSSADTFKAKINATGVVTGRAPATVNIFYTFPATGCYNSAAMVVNPLPTFITGANAFCKGSIDSLNNLTVGGTYSSSTPGIVSVGVGDGQAFGVSAGYANITYTLPTGCYVTKQLLVHPLPAPVISFDFVANSFSVQNYFVNYKWYKNGILITGATLNTIAADENANYTCTVIDTFGCTATSVVYPLTQLGIGSVNFGPQIHVVPNPANDFIKIEAPVAVRAVITSIEGKVVMDRGNAKTIDISSLTPGVYMIIFYDYNGNKLTVEKLIKE